MQIYNQMIHYDRKLGMLLPIMILLLVFG